MSKLYKSKIYEVLLLPLLVASSFFINSAEAALLSVTDQLVLRLESDAGITINAGGQVTAWADQSGQNHNAVVSGIGPLLMSNNLNGNPLLNFNGTSNSFALTGSPLLTSQQFTLFAIVDDKRTDTLFREVLSNWTPATSINSVFLGTTGSTSNPKVRSTDNFGGGTDPLNTQSGVGNINTPTQPFVLSAISNFGNAQVYQNGNLIAQHTGALTPRDLSSQFYIGKQGTYAGGEYWKGDIAAILVYNKALNTNEQTQVLGYLNSKYFGFASPVPVPAAIWLFGSALLGMIWLRRRK